MPLKARQSPGFDESEIQILVLLPGPGQLLTELCTNGPGAAEILSYLLSPTQGATSKIDQKVKIRPDLHFTFPWSSQSNSPRVSITPQKGF